MRHLLIGLLGCSLLGFGCKVGDGDGDVFEDGGQIGRDSGSDGDPERDAGRDSGLPPMTDSDGGADDEDAGGDDVPSADTVTDPAPDATAPGEYGCDDCPDTDLTEFELDLGSATSQTFSGVVTGAVGNGEFYLESTDGQRIAGVIPTDASGGYSFTIPLFCGTQLLKCLWSNDAGTYVAVTEIVTSDCVDADIRITLTWDDKGQDFELHLIKQGGTINDDATDCTWTSCMGQGPDWGVVDDASDNPRKDVDNTGTFGPENIFYAKPEDGTFTIMVEHWAAGTADADGRVTINLKDRPPVTVDITDLASHHVFTAATIEWPSKTVTVIGEDHDCTGNWSGGCRDMIP